jgi:hypothetical protein
MGLDAAERRARMRCDRDVLNKASKAKQKLGCNNPELWEKHDSRLWHLSQVHTGGGDGGMWNDNDNDEYESEMDSDSTPASDSSDVDDLSTTFNGANVR